MKNISLTIVLLGMVFGLLAINVSYREVVAEKRGADEAVRPAVVSMTIVTTPNCENCFDPYGVIQVIEKQPVEISDIQEVVFGTPEASELIETYDLLKLPALIVNGEIKKDNVKEMFSEMRQVSDEEAIMEPVTPLYIDAKTGGEVGNVEMVIIDDASCEECYDSTIHVNVLQNTYGMFLSNVNTVDLKSDEAAELIATYNIESVPTSLIRGDVGAYEPFVLSWNKFGSVEDDGTYVFRVMSAIPDATYRDLVTGRVITQLKNE